MSEPSFDDIPSNTGELVSAHIEQYLTDPEKAHMWDVRPFGWSGHASTLLLTATGRKSGEPRHTPLVYVDHEGGYLVMGSKGGNADHPIWFLNLLANPLCEIRVSTLRTHARARVLKGAERANAWEKIIARYPAYAKYQSRTDREIPVLLLEPIPS